MGPAVSASPRSRRYSPKARKSCWLISTQKSLEAQSESLNTDKAAFVAADVTDAAQTRRYVADTVDRWGKIDVLFSNAGNDGPLMPITEYPEDLFDRIVTTHVRGCFLSCKYSIPQMNDGGSIIITSSIVGVIGVPHNCSYVAAKHALMGLMRCVAKEVAPRRIRVNSVNPGPVDNVSSCARPKKQ